MMVHAAPPRAQRAQRRLPCMLLMGPFLWLLLPSPEQAVAQPGPRQETLWSNLEQVEAQAENLGLPAGTLLSLRYQLEVADRIEGRFESQANQWRRRGRQFLEQAAEGTDPFLAARGRIVNRAYKSELSQRLQGYAIYLPPGFDPQVQYPLLVVLHGGSSNGNLFLGVVLGNNMSWEHYREYLWDPFEPRSFPNLIVVAPDGFGQVMWRWMGEQDVLDVIADVQEHYPVDPNRVVLMGLSNGGVGAYAIGTRHASRFSIVQAVAGAPSWLLYTGGRPRPDELRVMKPLSMLNIPHNIRNTDFRYYHGRHDTGPMRPGFVERLERRLSEEEIRASGVWYDAGHDILYRVHRHGQRFDELAEVQRNPSPREVTIQTGDYRANRQHWVTVTRINNYPSIARLDAAVQAGHLKIETSDVGAFSVDLRTLPATGNELAIEVNNHQVYTGPRSRLGHIVHLRSEGERFALGFPASETSKRPGLSGPITDAYFGRMVHVFGTLNQDHQRTLQRAAEEAARGWPLWLWNYQQEVISDQEVTPELAAEAHLVLYGNRDNHRVLRAISDSLPIQVSAQGVTVGNQRFHQADAGVRFIYPNPMAPHRYVIVQGGADAEASRAGNRLPDFLPDYLVYDGGTTRRRERLIRGRSMALAAGFFSDDWELPTNLSSPQEDAAAMSRSLPAAARAARWWPVVPSAAGSHRERTREGNEQNHHAAGSPPTSRPGQTSKGKESTGKQAGADPNAAATPTSTPQPAADAGPEVEVVAPLPVPPAPPVPRRPRQFLAPESDQAGRAARAIAALVPTFHNYRAEIAGATWRLDRGAVWRVRPSQTCLEELRSLEVPFRSLGEHPTPVPTPVEILGPIGGIWYRIIHADRPLTISCELAVRLYQLSSILKRFRVKGVEVMSAYRETPRASFHTMGLGIDIARLWNGRGWINVLTDFEETPGEETCRAQPSTPRGRRVLRITCAIVRSRLFQSVLTPNYNTGHRNHWHLDARPDDPRLFHR